MLCKVVQWVVDCDRCLIESMSVDVETRKVNVVRQLRSEGWKKIGKEWVCPNCLKEFPNQEK